MKNYNFYVKKTITSGSSHDPAVVASTSSYSTWLRTVVKTENFPFSKKKIYRCTGDRTTKIVGCWQLGRVVAENFVGRWGLKEAGSWEHIE